MSLTKSLGNAGSAPRRDTLSHAPHFHHLRAAPECPLLAGKPTPPSMHVKPAQGLRLAVDLPGDVADPPLVLDGDEIEGDDSRLALIGKLDGGDGLARGLIGHRDVEGGRFPSPAR